MTTQEERVFRDPVEVTVKLPPRLFLKIEHLSNFFGKDFDEFVVEAIDAHIEALRGLNWEPLTTSESYVALINQSIFGAAERLVAG